LTEYLSAIAILLRSQWRWLLGSNIKISFLYLQHHRADTATNTQTAAMLDVGRKHKPNFIMLEDFKYNLTKLKKCNQIWDEMNPIEGGRLCSQCDKKIVDFSNMAFTDIAFFMAESKYPVCGYYLPQQIQEIKKTKSKFPIAIGLTTILSTSTIAQYEKNNIKIEQNDISSKSVNPVDGEIISLKSNNKIDSIYLIGTIQSFDSTRKMNVPISHAAVIVKGTKNGVLTMDNGDFKLPYLPVADPGVFYLTIYSVGLEQKEIEINFAGQKEINLGTIILAKNKDGLTEFWVTMKKRSKLNRFWRKITKPFRRTK
jgi:ssDNA-binding Zn-finger/Zn-ribbon topoisomerase 1